MTFRLTGISSLLKRHGRNLQLKRDLNTAYDPETSTTYKTLNEFNDFEATLQEIATGSWYYSNGGGLNIGSIDREFYNLLDLTGVTISEDFNNGEAGIGISFESNIALENFPSSIKVNGVVCNFVTSYLQSGHFTIQYEYAPVVDGKATIELNNIIATVRGYFYDSRNLSEYSTQIEEGNRRVVLYPYDTSGNALLKPEISDTIEGQRDKVSIWRVEEVMSNEKVLAYICRVKE